MKKTLLLLFSLALCLAACQNAEELTGEINNNTPKFTLKAVIDNGDDDADATRTIVGNDGYTKWEAGDEIDVLKETSSLGPVQTFKFTASELSQENKMATFTTTTSFQLDAYGAYVAGYPSGSISDGGLFPISLSCKLDSVQTYDADNMVASKCNPAIAFETKAIFEANKLFHFKNICGLLRLKFKGNTTIKAIRFITTGTQYVSGIYSFDPLLAQDPSMLSGYNKVKLDCGTGVALDAETDSIFYIVLPPATYNGFAIEAEDVDGYKKTYTSTKNHTIAHSKIHTIASLTFDKKGVWYNINNTGWVFWGTSTTLPAKATAGTFALKTDEGFTFSAAQMAAVHNFVRTSASNGSIVVDMNDAVYIDTIMPANAFSGNSKIKTFAIPKNIKALGEYAFNKCTYLSGISNTEQIDSLGKFCFNSCGSLTTFPTFNHVTRYPQSCFMACGFTSVTVPEGVTYLGQQCLNGLTKATMIDLPSTVDTLYQSTLGNCPKVADFYCRAMVAPVTINFTSTSVFNAGNLGGGIFIGNSVDPINRKLHVPNGATGYVKPDSVAETDPFYAPRKDWWKYLLSPISFNWTINYDL